MQAEVVAELANRENIRMTIAHNRRERMADLANPKRILAAWTKLFGELE